MEAAAADAAVAICSNTQRLHHLLLTADPVYRPLHYTYYTSLQRMLQLFLLSVPPFVHHLSLTLVSVVETTSQPLVLFQEMDTVFCHRVL